MTRARTADTTAPTKPERPSEKALEDYGQRFNKYLLYVSLAYLLVVLYELLPGYEMGLTLWVIEGVFCLIFVADYCWRVFALAPNRRKYMREPLCVLDAIVIATFPLTVILIFVVIPLVPALSKIMSPTVLGGITRLARVVTQLLRVGRVGVQGARTVGQAQRIFTRRKLGWVAILACGLAAYAALYVSMAEQSHGDHDIHGIGDAAWWAIATLETVDYGGAYPHSGPGRMVASILVLLGVALLSWFTAALSSLFVESEEERLDVHRLERLAAKHAKGNLTDTRFREKKAKVIGKTKLERLEDLYRNGDLDEKEFADAKARLSD